MSMTTSLPPAADESSSPHAVSPAPSSPHTAAIAAMVTARDGFPSPARTLYAQPADGHFCGPHGLIHAFDDSPVSVSSSDLTRQKSGASLHLSRSSASSEYHVPQ